MAEIVNDVEQSGEMEVVESQIAEQEAVKEAPEVPDIPQKYRGKNVEDVIKMHQEAEKMASRHAQEVGEVRRLADELIKAQLTKKPEVEQPTEPDYFENPQEAVRRAVETNPAVMRAQQMAMQVQQQMALQTLVNKHPDYADVNNSPEFQDWVKGSRVRQSIYQNAMNYDVDAADELLGTWKQLRAVKQRAITETETKARDNALTAASVDTQGTNESSKKVWSRAEIMNMRVYDPKKFEANRVKIEQAYAEGRVK